ncbi:MAG: transporter associated domain-containing protein, partial [Microbacterium sp.]
EIVGEVSDEHDRSRAGVVRSKESITFPGELRPDELLGRTGVRVPAGDVYDTVGGYIMSVLERVPAPGDEITLDSGALQVVRMDGRRVDRIRYTPVPVDVASEEVAQ